MVAGGAWRPNWRRELLIAVVLIAAGALFLPFAVYAVGQQVFGEYGADGGVANLLIAVWGGLAQGNALAWILVLSPYAVIQLLRVSWHLFRRPHPAS